MARKKSSASLLPNLGVYFQVPPIGVPDRGLSDCLNVRIAEGQLTNFNVGWERYSDNWKLDGLVTLIDNFFDSTGSQKVLFASKTDLYEWGETNDELFYLTPRYATGTISINNGSPTLTGAATAWLTSGLKVGDKIAFFNNAQRFVETDVPRYTNSGAAASVNAPANLVLPYMTGPVAANVAFAHITMIGDIATGIATPAGWSVAGSSPSLVGTGAGTGRQFLFYRRLDGTEAGNVTFVPGGGVARMTGRIHQFRITDAAWNTIAVVAGTGTTVSDVGITGTGNGLAINFVTVHGNGNAIPAFTGQTGGTWAVAASHADGVNAAMSVQIAPMLDGGTIDGGTATVTSGAWGVYGIGAQPVFWMTVLTVDNDLQITLTTNWPYPNVAGQSYTGRRLLTMDSNDVWSTDLFHNGLPGPADWWVGTNGIDSVLRWNGTDTQMTYLPTLGFTCKCLLRWKNMIVYGNLNVGGSRRRTSIRNSAIGDPFNVTTGEAAEFIAHDGVDEILTVLTIADNLVIYNIRSVTLAAFVGLPEFLAFRSVIAGIGPLSAMAVIDFGDNHEFIGPDASYEFDGISVQEVNYHVMREVVRQAPVERYNQIIAHFSEETGEIWWIVPQSTDASGETPEICYSEHYLEEVGETAPTPFTIRELPATATGYFERLDTLTWNEISTPWSSQNYRWDDRFFQGSFPFNLFGDINGFIYVIGAADTQAGEPITSFVRFGLKPAVDGQFKGLVQRVYPFATQLPGASYGLTVTLHTSDQMGMATTAASVLTYDLTQVGRRFVNPFKVGRFYAVEFGSSGVDRVWTLQGYDVAIAPMGER